MSLFELFLWACARSLHDYPKLNRFVSGGRLYQRHGVSLALSAKVGSGSSSRLATIKLALDDRSTTLEELSSQVDSALAAAHSGDRAIDRELALGARLPHPVTRLAMASYRLLDRFNMLPHSVIENDPSYSSCSSPTSAPSVSTAAITTSSRWEPADSSRVSGERSDDRGSTATARPPRPRCSKCAGRSTSASPTEPRARWLCVASSTSSSIPSVGSATPRNARPMDARRQSSGHHPRLLRRLEIWSQRAATLSLRYQRRILQLTLLVSLAALVPLLRVQFSGDLVALFMDESENARSYREIQERLGEREILLAAWRTSDPFDVAELEKQQHAARSIERLPGVRSVLSIATAPRLQRGERMGVEVTTWGDQLLRASRAEHDLLRAAARSDPELRGLFGPGASAMIIVLDDLAAMKLEDQLTLVSRLEDLLRRELDLGSRDKWSSIWPARDPGPAKGPFLVGLPAATASATELAERTLVVLGPLAALICLLALSVLLRSWRHALLGLALGLVCALWSTAAGVLMLGIEITVPQAAAPILVLTLSLSGYMFLVVEHSREQRRRSAKDAATTTTTSALAAVEAVRKVGPASILSKTTTALSLVALALVPAPAIRDLGLVAALGVVLAGVIELLVLPAVLWRLPPARPRRFRRVLQVSLWPASRNPRLAAALAIPLLIALVVLTLDLEVETDLMRRFEADHPLRLAEEFVATRIGGVSSLDVTVETEPGRVLAPAVVAAAARFENEVAHHPDVRSTSSVTNPLRHIDSLLHPDEPSPFGSTDRRARQALFFLPAAGPAALAGFVDDERSLLRISLRTESSGLLFAERLGRQIEEKARHHLGSLAEVGVTGLAPTLGRWLHDLHRTQLRNTLLLVCVLVATLWLAFDLRHAVWGLLPNIVPCLALFASLPLLGQHFDSDYLVVAMLGLGLAVDDTLHLLVRFRASRSAGRSDRVAVGRTIAAVGPSILMTTVLLIVGMLPLALSGYLSIRMFSTQLATLLIGAVAMDLVLVPCLLAAGVLSTGSARWPRSWLVGQTQRCSSTGVANDPATNSRHETAHPGRTGSIVAGP